MNMTIPEALDHLRQERGLRCIDMAVVLKADLDTLVNIMYGKQELSFEKAVRMLDHFNLSLPEFLDMLHPKELDRDNLINRSLWEKLQFSRRQYLKALPSAQ